MSTGTSLSLLEAAQRVGRSKPTILRAIQAGKISANRDEHTGEWRIEPAELFRVYPPLPEGIDASMQTGDDETSRTTSTDERGPGASPNCQVLRRPAPNCGAVDRRRTLAPHPQPSTRQVSPRPTIAAAPLATGRMRQLFAIVNRRNRPRSPPANC